MYILYDHLVRLGLSGDSVSLYVSEFITVDSVNNNSLVCFVAFNTKI